ncbi:MAG: hypothetical protein ACLFUB_06915 [Cyclobacteriaceae bacterium]
MRSIPVLIALLFFLPACTPAIDDTDVDHDGRMEEHRPEEYRIEEYPHMDENERRRLDSLKNRDMLSSIIP